MISIILLLSSTTIPFIMHSKHLLTKGCLLSDVWDARHTCKMTIISILIFKFFWIFWVSSYGSYVDPYQIRSTSSDRLGGQSHLIYTNQGQIDRPSQILRMLPHHSPSRSWQSFSGSHKCGLTHGQQSSPATFEGSAEFQIYNISLIPTLGS